MCGCDLVQAYFNFSSLAVLTISTVNLPMIGSQRCSVHDLPSVQSISLSFESFAIVTAVVLGISSIEGIERSRIEDKLHALPCG